MESSPATGGSSTARPDNEHARPVPRLPQLLRHARLRAAAARSSSSRCKPYVAAAARALRRRRRAARRRSQAICASRRARATVDFVDGTVFGPDELYLTLGAFADTRAVHVSDYTGMRHLLPVDPAARPTTADRSATTCGAGTPTGSGARARSACRTRWSAGCGRGAGGARTSTAARRARPAARRHRPGSTAGAAGRPRGAVIQDVEVPVEPAAGVPRLLRRARSASSPVWLCPLRQRDRDGRGRCTRWSPAQLYVNVGFWWHGAAAPGRRATATTTG